MQVKGITSVASSAIKSHMAGKALLGHVEFGRVTLENTSRSMLSEMRAKPMFSLYILWHCISAAVGELLSLTVRGISFFRHQAPEVLVSLAAL